MDLIVNGFLVKDLNNIEQMKIRINEVNYKLIKAKLIQEQENIIEILKELKNTGTIRSVSIPKNKEMQEQLNNLVRIKKDLTPQEIKQDLS